MDPPSTVKDFDAQVNVITYGPRRDPDAYKAITIRGFDMQVTDNILAGLARDFHAADAYFTKCLSGATPRTVLAAKDSLDKTFHRVNTQLNNLTTGIKDKITEGSVDAASILDSISSFHDLCLYTKNIADGKFRKLITSESVSTSLDDLQTLWTHEEDNLKRLEWELFNAQSKLERYKAIVSSQFGSLASVTSHKGCCGLDSNDTHNKGLPVGNAINDKPITEDFLDTRAITTQCQTFATSPTPPVVGCLLSEKISNYRFSAPRNGSAVKPVISSGYLFSVPCNGPAVKPVISSDYLFSVPCNGPAVQPDLIFSCRYSEAYNGPAAQPKISSNCQYSATRSAAADATKFNRGFHTCEMSIDSSTNSATVTTNNSELLHSAQYPVITPSSPRSHQDEASVNPNSNDFVEFVKTKTTLTRSPFGPVNYEFDCSFEPEDVDLNVPHKMYSKNPRKTAMEVNSTSMDSNSMHRYVAEKELRSSCILCQDLHPLFNFEDIQEMQVLQRHGYAEESLLRRNCLFCDHGHNFCPSWCSCKIHGCGCAQSTLLHDAYNCSLHPKLIVVASNNTDMALSPAIAEISFQVHLSTPLVIITCLVASTSLIAHAFLISGATNCLCTFLFLNKLVISGEPLTYLINTAAILLRQPKFVPISVKGIG